MKKLLFLSFLLLSSTLLYTIGAFTQENIDTKQNTTQEHSNIKHTIAQDVPLENTEAISTTSIIQLPKPWYKKLGIDNGLVAKFNFGENFLVVHLLYQDMPLSVMYFLGLASARFNQQSIIETTWETEQQNSREKQTEQQNSTEKQTEQQNSTEKQTEQQNSTEEQIVPEQTNIVATALPSPELYTNGTVVSYTPEYILYANIHEKSPEEYQQYTFMYENYFDPPKRQGKGFLALYGTSLLQISSRLVFILSDIETFPLSVPIIGDILYDHSSFNTVEELSNIDSVEIQALGNRANNFLSSITWDTFQSLVQEEEDNFIKNKQQNIDAIRQELNEKIYRESNSGIFFEFRTGKVTDNIANITTKDNDVSQLISTLNNNPLNITELDNSYLKNGNTIHFDYTMRVYNSNSTTYIDNSFEYENSMSYVVGQDTILKGIEQIFTIMSPEQTVYAIIPPSLAYNNDGLGKIVGVSDFIEVEISMLSKARTQRVIDLNSNNESNN